MMCAGIIAKHTDPRAESIVSELCNWLEGAGRKVVLDRETASLVGRADGVVRSQSTTSPSSFSAARRRLALFCNSSSLLSPTRATAASNNFFSDPAAPSTTSLRISRSML